MRKIENAYNLGTNSTQADIRLREVFMKRASYDQCREQSAIFFIVVSALREFPTNVALVKVLEEWLGKS